MSYSGTFLQLLLSYTPIGFTENRASAAKHGKKQNNYTGRSRQDRVRGLGREMDTNAFTKEYRTPTRYPAGATLTLIRSAAQFF